MLWFSLVIAVCWYLVWARLDTSNRALALTVPSALPVLDQSDGRCGVGWQLQYANLHKSILQGRQPKRLCIAVIREEQGLYDRMTGIVRTPLLRQEPVRVLPYARSLSHDSIAWQLRFTSLH